MIDPWRAGRPLDDREAREFERIVRAIRAESDPPAATDPEPVTAAPPRVTWGQVALVLAAAAVFALVTTTLPHPLNLWSPVVVLAVVCAVCIAWGWRSRT